MKRDQGTTLVHDSLFIADSDHAYEEKFISSNKITHIVNTSSIKILNIFKINDKSMKS